MLPRVSPIGCKRVAFRSGLTSPRFRSAIAFAGRSNVASPNRVLASLCCSLVFFNKDWPQNELNGLFALEVMGRKTILPVWHELSATERCADGRQCLRIGSECPRIAVSITSRIDSRRQFGSEVRNQNRRSTATHGHVPRSDSFFASYQGEDTGRIFPLAFMRMVVGRSTSADIQLSERSASRSHFSILWSETDRRHVVQDWGHPNRIYINDNGIERHAEHVLNVGDTVRLGDTVLRYEIRTGGV